MGASGWLATAGGFILTASVLLDVFITVLHMDRDGPLARSLIRGVWRLSRLVGRIAPRLRRSFWTLAGPVAIAAVFGTWMCLFVVGFALIYWPRLDSFSFANAIDEVGFITALYFSGNVSTVLGFGDITPRDPVLQATVVTQAALGFGVVTAGITYLLKVILSTQDRNILARRLWIESGRTSDGLQALLMQLETEDISDVHARFLSLTQSLYHLEEQLRRLPVIDLLYRSGPPEHSTERMLQTGAGLAMSARIAARGTEARRLGAVADQMSDMITLIMRNAIVEWFGSETVARFDRAEDEPRDHERVREVIEILDSRLPHLGMPPALGPLEDIRRLESRTRIFLAATRGGSSR